MAGNSTAEVIAALAKPEAFPEPVPSVEVHQTHISAVFLGGSIAYKVKKPVDLGFLDFTTLERRRHFCEEEVRINRRLAPKVYLGVVPIAMTDAGLRFEAPGLPAEWAVKMIRVPPECNLEHRLERDEIDPGLLRSLAARLVDFHRTAKSGDEVSRSARWDRVAANVLANLDSARRHVGRTLSDATYERLNRRTREVLDECRSSIERRAVAGMPRETHGDLRLDHVYWFPESSPPDDWCILDGVEFNEQFRYADPVSDIAFLVMDLAFRGRWDLARSFAADYFDQSGDADGGNLLPLYASYRSAIRGKVDEIRHEEAEIPEAVRSTMEQKAKAHWLAALAWLEPAEQRPQVVLIGGLPGSGKTTLARSLAQRLGAEVVRSDVVRKELAGIPERSSASAPFGQGIYSDAWNETTMRELMSRAEAILWTGGKVVVDASLRQDSYRQRFVELARHWGVPVTFLNCEVSPDVAKNRLRHRHGDVSDADDAVYEAASRLWEPCSPRVARLTHRIDADRGIDDVIQEAMNAVRG